MARITRKELKKDEFALEVSRTYEFVQTHKDQLLMGAAALGLAVLVGLGGYLLAEKRKTNANEALGRAMRTYHAPVRSTAALPEPEGENSFATEKEKYTQALKEFLAIAQKYSWLKPGQVARYYAGLCQANLGNLSEAEKEWNAAIRRGDQDLAALARFALANAQARAGNSSQAEKLYRYLLEHPSAGVPKVSAQLALADSLRRSRPAEAEKLYLEIEKQNRNSAAAELAQQGLAELKQPNLP